MSESNADRVTKARARGLRIALTPERQRLAARYLPLARSLAKPYKVYWPGSYDDFDAEANLALVEAAESFDPERGVNFATFARHRIDGALRDMRREKIDHDQRFMTHVPSSGDLLQGGGCETDRGRLICVREPEPVGEEMERGELVEHWLSKLPRKHAYACRQAYFHGRTQQEIAKDLGYSQSRMSNIHQEALRMLREIGESEGLAA
jgi:RNA polymerase sigma factor (sigma-70 family)